MNTNLTTRSTVLAACFGVLFAGATACGTGHGTTTPTAVTDTPHAISTVHPAGPSAVIHSRREPSSSELIETAKANQHAYLRQLRALRPHPGRSSHG